MQCGACLLKASMILSPDDWSTAQRQAATLGTLGHWWGSDASQYILSIHGLLAVKYGAQLYRHPHGTMEVVVGTGSEMITARILRTVAFALGYGSPVDYVTACMQRPRDVEARLAMRASSIWAA